MSTGLKTPIKLKVYSKKELAEIYSIDRKTLNKWLKLHEEEIGRRHGNYFSIPQVRIIFAKLGLPGDLIIEP